MLCLCNLGYPIFMKSTLNYFLWILTKIEVRSPASLAWVNVESNLWIFFKTLLLDNFFSNKFDKNICFVAEFEENP